MGGIGVISATLLFLSLLGESLGEALMRALITFVVLLALGGAVYAAETITYTYDARGRVVQVARTGSVNNKTTTYVYDKAHNAIRRRTC
jgi:hypothetical protein